MYRMYSCQAKRATSLKEAQWASPNWKWKGQTSSRSSVQISNWLISEVQSLSWGRYDSGFASFRHGAILKQTGGSLHKSLVRVGWGLKCLINSLRHTLCNSLNRLILPKVKSAHSAAYKLCHCQWNHRINSLSLNLGFHQKFLRPWNSLPCPGLERSQFPFHK